MELYIKIRFFNIDKTIYNMYNTIEVVCVRIEEADIKYSHYCTGVGNMGGVDNVVHIKQLPYLSVVQSKIGRYGIRIDDGREQYTDEGGFFIAPSLVTQKITHKLNSENKLFGMRYIFLDIVVNNSIRFDDLFDVPLVPGAEMCRLLNEEFDALDKTEDVCERKCAMYRIVKILLDNAKEKSVKRNEAIAPLIKLMHSEYAKEITVKDMAQRVNMSESNLYAVFKKAVGMSPVKYLNEYRLSVASLLLTETDYDIKSIAEKVGISDQFYFSRLFKKKYTVSPTEYRKGKYVSVFKN